MSKIKNLVMLVLLISAITVTGIGTAAAKTVKSETLIKGEYGALPLGDQLYAVNYDDGSMDLKLVHNNFMKASISAIPETTYASTADNPKVPITIQGVAKAIDNQDSHTHRITVTDLNGNLVKSQDFVVPSDQSANVEITFDKMNAGTYVYSIKETVLRKTGFRHDWGSVNSGTNCQGWQNDWWQIEGTWQTGSWSGVWCSVPGLPSAGSTAKGTIMYADIGATVAGSQKTFAITVSQKPIVTAAPTSGSGQTLPKIQIVPPAISRLMGIMSSWFTSLLGLSISGGQTVNTVVNQPYTTQISLNYAAYTQCNPDSPASANCGDLKYAEWFIVDSNKQVIKESGWSDLLTASGGAWNATATFRPTNIGTYYLVGVVNKQTYTYTDKWSMIEGIETKELQVINVRLPGVATTSPGSASSLFKLPDFSNWFNNIWSWLGL